MADSAEQPQNSLGRKCVTHKEEDVWLRCEYCKFYMCHTCVKSRDHQHQLADMISDKRKTIEDFIARVKSKDLTRIDKEIESTPENINKISNVYNALSNVFPSLKGEFERLQLSNEAVMNNHQKELNSRSADLRKQIKTYSTTVRKGSEIQILDTESDIKNSPGLLGDIPPLKIPPPNLDILRLVISQLAIPGFRKCEKLCKFCEINADSRHYFKSSIDGNPYPIDHGLTCSSANVIYLITCSRCKMQYVGETSMSLSDRFYGHRWPESKLHADKHFWENGHSLNDMKVIAIEQNQSWKTPERCEREQYWMVKLQTKDPQGLNKK